MGTTYFSDLVKRTPTRVWVNNPTRDEVQLALGQGAVGCTTNPAFVGGLVRRAPGEVLPLIAEIVSAEPDDERAGELLQERMVVDLLRSFRPVHDATNGQLGFVSLQGAPERDTETDPILEAAHRARALGPNCIPKIPATIPGLDAADELIRAGEPVLITEVFSLAQVIESCERYLAITAETGQRPPFFMAPITGIFGDHLRAVARRDGIAVDPQVLEMAGILFARAAAQCVRERGYPVTLLFGGARTMLDLTGLVGEKHQATVNWSTFAEVLAADVAVAATIEDEVPEAVRKTLTGSFTAMRQALAEDGLDLEEFEGFGPVQHFRDNFISGWTTMLGAIRDVRGAAAGVKA